MEGKGTPKNEQNQFCHSPSVKAMAPSEVERQDSHAAGVKYSLRDLSPSLMQAVKMECRGSPASASGGFQWGRICLVIRFCLGKRDEVAAVPSAGPEESGCASDFELRELQG